MEIVIIIVLILLNGVLSMSEIALVSARRSKLETEAKRGSVRARTALNMSDDPDRFLSTVQIGITLIGILTGLYSGEAFSGGLSAVIAKVDFLAPYSVVIAKTAIVLVVTYLTLIFGELVPKRLGMSRAEKVSKVVAKPMHVLSRIASPLVWILSKSTALVVGILGIEKNHESSVTEEEIKAIVKEGLSSGEVQEVEHDIVERVFSLGDRDVESIMTHRSDLVWLDTTDTLEETKRKVMENMHDVYPVARGGNDNFAGAMLMKDLFGHIDSTDFNLESIISPAHFLPENQSVYGALERFKGHNVKCGFVINEFGELQGMVTLTDILEALVGHVEETGQEKEITKRSDGTYLVDGQCSFYNFLEYFDLEHLYPENNYNTLSGLILEELNRIPVTGDTIEWDGFRFEIVDMDGARIDKVLVTHNKSEE